MVMQSFLMNSHEAFIHMHQGSFAGTGAIVRLPQCQWSKPDGYGKISQSITTTKHSKAKTVCIFLGIYCSCGVVKYSINQTTHQQRVKICAWIQILQPCRRWLRHYTSCFKTWIHVLPHLIANQRHIMYGATCIGDTTLLIITKSHHSNLAYQRIRVFLAT